MNSRSENEISRTGTPAGSLVIHLIPPLVQRKGHLWIVQNRASG